MPLTISLHSFYCDFYHKHYVPVDSVVEIVGKLYHNY